MTNHADWSKLLHEIFSESAALRQTSPGLQSDILAAGDLLVEALKGGRTIFAFGNGGSAADAQHFVAELGGRFHILERRALPGVALTTNTSILTALANDYDYRIVFSRQLEALGHAGDIAVGISTSGNAANVLAGFLTAQRLGLRTLFLTGRTGGRIASEISNLDCVIRIPSDNTGRIQEMHITIIHLLCEFIEHGLF